MWKIEKDTDDYFVTFEDTDFFYPRRIKIFYKVIYIQKGGYGFPDFPSSATKVTGIFFDSENNAYTTEEMPTKTESKEVPRPKTKREVRWHNGYWQALYKNGWAAI